MTIESKRDEVGIWEHCEQARPHRQSISQSGASLVSWSATHKRTRWTRN